MQNFKLSFGNVIILKEDLAEIIIDEGVEVNGIMVEKLHDFLLRNLNAPFRLLINTQNSYSYTFRAQIQIAMLKEIEAIGVSVGSEVALMSIETMIFLSKNNSCVIQFEIFKSRIEALAWLQSIKILVA